MRALEEQWEAHTLAANAFFEQGQYEAALPGYAAALRQAEALNEQAQACLELGVPFVQMYIIACNNLSNTYLELGQLAETERLLKRPIYYLLHLQNEASVAVPDLESELRRATLVYLAFAKQTGINQQAQRQLLSEIQEQRQATSQEPDFGELRLLG